MHWTEGVGTAILMMITTCPAVADRLTFFFNSITRGTEVDWIGPCAILLLDRSIKVDFPLDVEKNICLLLEAVPNIVLQFLIGENAMRLSERERL
jgi:hypothetical protein